MSLESAVAGRNALLTTIGKNALNIKYPKEFELYLIALELTDENYNTLKYFVFPINPSSLEENIPKLTNVKKTLAGVVSLKTSTFVPTDITLNGNFGRKFKVLLGSTYEDFLSSFVAPTGKVSRESFLKGTGQIFDERIKTGYGCIKILEEIIKEADRIGENGQLRKLIFHNPALGNSYLVEPVGGIRISQNQDSNMIWNYSLQLKSIAPLESLYTKEGMEKISKQLNVTGYIQKRVNQVVSGVASIVGNVLNRAN